MMIRAAFALVAGTIAVAVVAANSGPSAGDAQAASQAQSKSVAGEWMLAIHGDHVMKAGLTLQQDGPAVTGTMTIMGRDASAEGEFVDRILTLTVGATIVDHAGGNAATKIRIKAALKDDGTLDGEMTGGRGPMKITAERFKPRRR